MLNLFLLQRQRVLHGIGFALGLNDLGLRVAFGLLHLLRFFSFSLQFGNLHLLLLHVGFHAHLVVLLFLEQQAFKSLGVLLRQLNVGEHDLFHHDAVSTQLAGDDLRGLGADFFAFGTEDFAHCELRREFAPCRCHHGRHQFLIDGLRHVSLHAIELVRIEPVAHRDS